MRHQWIGMRRLVYAMFVMAVLSNRAPAQLASPGLILLKDGQLLTGVVHEVPGGYGIQMKSGFQMIEHEKIDLIASSLEDAYQKKRRRIKKPTYEAHMTLARWCLEHRLFDQAQSEVELGKRLAAQSENQQPTVSEAKNRPQVISTANGVVMREVRSTTGLLRSTHQEFIRRVQPLLMNKCGNAGCHSETSGNNFRLETIRLGTAGNRLQNHANLVETLKQIDFNNPQSSPLLTQPGAASHPEVFTGGSGTAQFELLKAWVVEVGQTAKVDRKKLDQPLIPAPSKYLRFEPRVEQAGHEQPKTPTVPTVPQVLDHSEANPKAIDLFDPDEFNRKVHGASSAVLRSRRTEAKKSGSIPPN